MAQQRLEVVTHGNRAFQHRLIAYMLGQMAPAHFQHRLQLGELSRPQAQMLDEDGLAGLQQRTQAAKLPQQMASQVHRAFTRDAGTQENRQQLGIRETRRPQLQKLLPRALRRRPIANTHGTSVCMCAAVAWRTLCYLSRSFLRAISPGEGGSQRHH